MLPLCCYNLVFDHCLGDPPPSVLKEPPPDLDLDLYSPTPGPPIHLTKWAKMALTHRILPELSSSMSCLGWYWGRTGQAIWLAWNRPKSENVHSSDSDELASFVMTPNRMENQKGQNTEKHLQ